MLSTLGICHPASSSLTDAGPFALVDLTTRCRGDALVLYSRVPINSSSLSPRLLSSSFSPTTSHPELQFLFYKFYNSSTIDLLISSDMSTAHMTPSKQVLTFPHKIHFPRSKVNLLTIHFTRTNRLRMPSPT